MDKVSDEYFEAQQKELEHDEEVRRQYAIFCVLNKNKKRIT